MGLLTATQLAKAGFEWVRGAAASAMGRRTDGHQDAQVIPLHAERGSASDTSNFAFHGATPVRAEPPASNIKPVPEVYGLHNHPTLVEYRARDHFDAGYRDGVDRPDYEGLDEGIGRQQAHFDDLLDGLAAEYMVLIGQAEHELLNAGQQVRPLLEDRLRLDIKQYNGDIGELQKQRDLALQGKGWYRAILADYRAGFMRGWNDHPNARGPGR